MAQQLSLKNKKIMIMLLLTASSIELSHIQCTLSVTLLKSRRAQVPSHQAKPAIVAKAKLTVSNITRSSYSQPIIITRHNLNF